MKNFSWRYTFLQVSDLPAKAQCFIDIMNLDVSGLKLMRLEADPNGGFIKGFPDEPDNTSAVYSRFDDTIYFIKPVKVGVVIHELTHFYLDTLNDFISEEYTAHSKAISKSFIDKYGHEALSNYASVSLLNDKWDEVVCEIVAVYGRRGQFGKIKGLLEPCH